MTTTGRGWPTWGRGRRWGRRRGETMERADVDDPELGRLWWDNVYNDRWWREDFPFRPDYRIALRVLCGGEDDPEEVLARARRIVADLREREPALRREAAEQYLLELSNNGWRNVENGDPPL